MTDRHGGETDLTPHSSPVRTAATLLAWHSKLAGGELAAAQLGYQPDIPCRDQGSSELFVVAD
jgi:hypothetical protein